MGTITDVINDSINSKINFPLGRVDDPLSETEKEIARYIDAYYPLYRDRLLEQMSDLKWIAWDAVGIATVTAVGLWQDEILKDTGATYDSVKGHVDTMLVDPETKLYDATHLFSTDFDTAISSIINLLGFKHDTVNNKIVTQAGDILQRMAAAEQKLKDTVAPFDEETIAKLTWVADHYETIKAIAENDIVYIIGEVIDAVTPKVTELVNAQMATYDKRLSTVEAIVASHEYFFFDWLMDMIAAILAPGVAMEGDLEAAIEQIKQWVTEEVERQTIEMKAEIAAIESILYLEQQWWIDALKEKLEITGDGNGGLSAAQVQSMINVSLIPISSQIAGVQSTIAGLQIPTETQIKKWIDEAAPTVDITKHIHEIDVSLHDRLTSELKPATLTLTGAVDKLWYDMNTVNEFVWNEVKPITDFLTDDMRTSLTDIVEAFGTPEALLSYLVNAPEGQEEPLLDLLQVLLTMAFERGI